jgi:hypothetical protein
VEASGAFLVKELILCNINFNDTYYITENIEDAYYCVPTIDNGQWNDLDSQIDLAELLIAEPYKGLYDVLYSKKIEGNPDTGLNGWLKLQK